MFLSTSENLVGGLFLWLLLILGVGIIACGVVAMVMVFTDHDPSDVRRAIAERTYKRKRREAADRGEELPPEPDPALVLMPAITKEPGAVPRTYGSGRECKRCYSGLSRYWPEDVCLDCIATGRVHRDAITGSITNR
jgi:hypothetical protein